MSGKVLTHHNRAKVLLERLEYDPLGSFPEASHGWAETQAAYRFFGNPKISKDKLLAPHFKSTLNRVRQHPIVLCVEDTTFMNHDGQKKTSGLGPHSSELEHGYFVHPLIAITPEKLCLGVLNVYTWSRGRILNKRRFSARTPIEEKESYRWLQGYKKTSKYQQMLENTKLVYMADRESDIYELFLEGQFGNSSWLIRAIYNRNTVNSGKLLEELLASNAKGETTFEILTDNLKRSKRKVTQLVYFKKINLTGPRRKGKGCLPNLTVTAILAKEKDAPDKEKPIDWLLLTNLPVNSFNEALEKISWYTCRWQVEIFFYVLKSGCNVEKLQLETRERLEAALALYMIIAWRLMYTKRLGFILPNISCELVFNKKEWQMIYAVAKNQSPPDQPPTLKEIVTLVATLGGYLNRKNDGDPGVKTIWIGIQKLHNFMTGIEAQKLIKKQTCV